jgi:hypothetical protein
MGPRRGSRRTTRRLYATRIRRSSDGLVPRALEPIQHRALPAPPDQKKPKPPPFPPNRGFTTLLKMEPNRYSNPMDVKYR